MTLSSKCPSLSLEEDSSSSHLLEHVFRDVLLMDECDVRAFLDYFPSGFSFQRFRLLSYERIDELHRTGVVHTGDYQELKSFRMYLDVYDPSDDDVARMTDEDWIDVDHSDLMLRHSVLMAGGYKTKNQMFGKTSSLRSDDDDGAKTKTFSKSTTMKRTPTAATPTVLTLTLTLTPATVTPTDIDAAGFVRDTTVLRLRDDTRDEMVRFYKDTRDVAGRYNVFLGEPEIIVPPHMSPASQRVTAVALYHKLWTSSVVLEDRNARNLRDTIHDGYVFFRLLLSVTTSATSAPAPAPPKFSGDLFTYANAVAVYVSRQSLSCENTPGPKEAANVFLTNLDDPAYSDVVALCRKVVDATDDDSTKFPQDYRLPVLAATVERLFLASSSSSSTNATVVPPPAPETHAVSPPTNPLVERPKRRLLSPEDQEKWHLLDYGPDPDLPEGWIREVRKRKKSNRNRVDKFWFSPEAKKFRSKAEVLRWFQRMGLEHTLPNHDHDNHAYADLEDASPSVTTSSLGWDDESTVTKPNNATMVSPPLSHITKSKHSTSKSSLVRPETIDSMPLTNTKPTTIASAIRDSAPSTTKSTSIPSVTTKPTTTPSSSCSDTMNRPTKRPRPTIGSSEKKQDHIPIAPQDLHLYEGRTVLVQYKKSRKTKGCPKWYRGKLHLEKKRKGDDSSANSSEDDNDDDFGYFRPHQQPLHSAQHNHLYNTRGQAGGASGDTFETDIEKCIFVYETTGCHNVFTPRHKFYHPDCHGTSTRDAGNCDHCRKLRGEDGHDDDDDDDVTMTTVPKHEAESSDEDDDQP